MNDKERIDSLEKRVKSLEELVNDIMLHFDNPIRDQVLDGSGSNQKKPSKI